MCKEVLEYPSKFLMRWRFEKIQQGSDLYKLSSQRKLRLVESSSYSLTEEKRPNRALVNCLALASMQCEALGQQTMACRVTLEVIVNP